MQKKNLNISFESDSAAITESVRIQKKRPNSEIKCVLVSTNNKDFTFST